VGTYSVNHNHAPASQRNCYLNLIWQQITHVGFSKLLN